MDSTTERLRCRAEVNGRACRAMRLRGRQYCFGHRYEPAASAAVTVAELFRLAEEFDQRSAEAGELYSAAEFVSWLKPEVADG